MRAASANAEPIAIIGIGCRFPGAVTDAESFWNLLVRGGDAISEVPADRWSIPAYFHPEPGIRGKTYSYWGGFVDGIDTFEPECFGISPREAAFMDPQQRMLLEVTWEALEDAGVPVERLAGSNTGVFAGISTWDYSQIQGHPGDRTAISAFSALGNNFSIVANRLSFCLDLRGPSMAIDTACSSSLVAVDRALKSLRTGECQMAIAGGTNAILNPDPYIAFCAASMLAPDGRCKAFDARANGFVRGEGAGVVVLKPLSRAIDDGNPVIAVILNSGSNQDGRSSSIAVPNPEAQSNLLHRVYGEAHIDCADVCYVEAHGPGTTIGDPIEAGVLGELFSRKERPLYVGSVKTNIGHLEAASGIAGLIKLALCVHHRAIPPSLHFETPNPEIDFDGLNLRIPTALTPWPDNGRPATGGVNSFGFGGTNAHVVVAEHVAPEPVTAPASTPPDRLELLPLSARSEQALAEVATSFMAFLGGDGESRPDFHDVCFSASTRRTAHDTRLAIVAASGEEAIGKLAAFVAGERQHGVTAGVRSGDGAGIAFVFSGQGTQWRHMGRGLMATEPVFRDTVERCEREMTRCGARWSLLEEIGRSVASSNLQQTAIAQPAIFAIQAGLVDLWRSWGVHPGAVAGHSVGEIAAAYAAGVFPLEEAARLVFHRGRCMDQAPAGGRMLAAQLNEAAARRIIAAQDGDVSLAAVNGPQSVTFSGDATAVETVAATLERQGTWNRFLAVSHAFHSEAMESARAGLLEVLIDLRPRAASVPLISTVLGSRLEGAAMDAAYWWRNVRDPVLFHDATKQLLRLGCGLFIDVGPHPALLPSVAQSAGDMRQRVTLLPSLRREEDERRTMLGSVGSLFVAGCPVDWQALGPRGARYVRLPRHPWHRKRYWIESARTYRQVAGYHPLLGHALDLATATWQQALDPAALPYLRDHKVDSNMVLPASAFVELALAAACRHLGTQRCQVEDLQLHRALILDAGSTVMIQTRVEPGDCWIEIQGRPEKACSGWTRHASASCREAGASDPPPAIDLEPIRRRVCDPVSTEALYDAFATNGLGFGPAFRGIAATWSAPGEALGEVELPGLETGRDDGYQFHPALLDSCFQVLSAAVEPGLADGLYLPERVTRVSSHARAAGRVFSHARVIRSNKLVVEGDLRIYSPGGELLMEIDGLLCRRVNRPDQRGASRLERCLYELEWQPAEAPAEQDAAETEQLLRGKTWLLLADRRGVGSRLASWLRGRGARSVLVRTGPAYRRLGADRYVVSPDSRDDMTAMLADCTAGHSVPIDGMVQLWSLDLEAPGSTTADTLERAEVTLCHGLLHLLQAWNDHRYDRPTRLLLVTRGTRVVTSDDRRPAFAASSLTGLGRTISNELGSLRVRLVDLDRGGPGAAADQLATEIVTDPQQEEIAWRDGARHVPRLVRTKPGVRHLKLDVHAREMPSSFELVTRQPGVLDSLVYRETVRARPGPGEVEVAVRHVALNFRDVLKALGIYPAMDPRELSFGDECTGIVTDTGTGVDHVQRGDEVVVVVPGCLGGFVTAPAGLVFRVPAGLSAADAVTMPIAFLTASYALNHLARISASDSVLIHAAAGGVGMAAIQIARQAGAVLFATAGTLEKRELLTSLGAHHVMDSRSLAFADEIRELTGGRGVDVVLNSLSGKALSKSLDSLAPYGRFLELGKRDLYENRKLGIWALRRNASLFVIDLGAVLLDKPATGEALVRELSQSMESGAWQPLINRRVAATEVGEAFRTMSQGKHVGKIVIDLGEGELAVERNHGIGNPIRADATYLVTGGLGGFGLAVARWIVTRGGQHLVLVGRRDPASHDAVATIDALRGAGANVTTLRCDVADREQVAATLARIDATMPPLAGIFHAAAVLDDGVLLNLDRERFSKVMRPKVLGAWHLHELTLCHALDLFVLFSSISAGIGNPGQANYAAANSFLEGLACYRRGMGLPASAIEWGLVSGVGMAAGRDELVRLSRHRGLETMTADECLEALNAALQREATISVVGRFDWDRLAGALGADKHATGILSALAGTATDERDAGGEDLRSALSRVAGNERQQLVEEYLCRRTAHVLGAVDAEISRNKPLRETGFDSLMWVEMITMIERDLSTFFPTGSVSPEMTIRDLAAVLLHDLESGEHEISGERSGRTVSLASRTASAICTLIPLRTSGEPDPLFLVHPLGVHEGVYRPLVEALKLRRPIYGIQSALEKDDQISIDERAEAFAEAVRELQPAGPYTLCGYSIGAHLALKTAKLLENQGEEIGLVGVVEWELDIGFDPRSSEPQISKLFGSIYHLLQSRFGILAPISDVQLEREAGDAARRMLAAEHDERREFALKWLTDNRYVTKPLPMDVLGGYFRQIYVNYALLVNDTPLEPITAPIHVWRARNGLGAGHLSWQDSTSGSFSVELVDGDHFSLMIPPHVEALAKTLERRLEAVQAAAHEPGAEMN